MSGDLIKPTWGPKMAALPNDRWRSFVIEWLDGSKLDGRGSKGYTQAARRAGFKGNDDTMRKTGYTLAHDPRIQEAIQEEARKRMVLDIPIGLVALREIAENKDHKDRLNAAKTLLDRTGLHEIHETKTTHEVITEDPMLIERIRQLALQLGVPLEKLVGTSTAKQIEAKPEPIVVEFEEVPHD